MHGFRAVLRGVKTHLDIFYRHRRTWDMLVVFVLAVGLLFMHWPGGGVFGPLGKMGFGVQTARAAIALVQTANATTNGNGANTITATFTAVPKANNLLVGIVGAVQATALSVPSGWTLATSTAAGPSQVIFYKVAGASEPTGITSTSTVSSHLGIQIYEYSGLETNAPLNAVGSASGNATTSAFSGSVATTQSNELILAGITITGQTSFASFNNSFTKENDVSNGTGSSGNRGTYAGADRIVSATGTYSTTGIANAAGNYVGQVVAFRAVINLNETAYRWFTNMNATSVGPAVAVQDNPATILSPGTPLRLRLLIQVASNTMNMSARSFKLQFVDKGAGTCASPSGTTPSVYTDVATSTGVFHFYDNTAATSGDPLSATSTDPVYQTDTIINETYQETNPFTNSIADILAGQDGKWDFAIVDNGAVSGEHYCFRVVENDGSLLNAYISYPEIISGNLPPSVSNVGLNGGNDIALIEGTTTPITASGTVSDPNGYTDIVSVLGKAYLASTTENCALNDNNCYQSTSCALSGCAGTSCTAVCNFKFQYHADPTDTGTPWAGQSWLAWMKAVDSQNASSVATSSIGVNVLSLVGLTAGPTLSYGNLSPGSNTPTLAQPSFVTSTGNVSMNVTVYGADMTSGANTLPLGNQRYATSVVAFASGTALAASPGATVTLDMPKTIASSTPATSTIFWGIQVPNPQPTGNYTGVNTFIGVKHSLPWP